MSPDYFFRGKKKLGPVIRKSIGDIRSGQKLLLNTVADRKDKTTEPSPCLVAVCGDVLWHVMNKVLRLSKRLRPFLAISTIIGEVKELYLYEYPDFWH